MIRDDPSSMIVLDASVILKWLFLGEPHRDKALQIREKHLAGQETIAVPGLLPYEIANALATKTAVPDEEALRGIIQVLSYELDMHHPEADDHVQILRLSRARHISAYDAAYLCLAEKLHCECMTADEKLYEKTKALSYIRLLSH